MFWYYLAGFISGIISCLMYGRHLVKKHGGNNNEVR